MKKALSLFLAVLMLVSVVPMAASAACANGNHNLVFDYTIESTCTSRGMDVYKCTMCDYSYKDWQHPYSYAPHELEYSFWEGAEANCYVRSKCKNCDYGQARKNESTNGKHIDENNDKVCDFCHRDFSGCNHLCHKGGFFYKIALFFWKLFKSNKNCKCGYPHY